VAELNKALDLILLIISKLILLKHKSLLYCIVDS